MQNRLHIEKTKCYTILVIFLWVVTALVSNGFSQNTLIATELLGRPTNSSVTLNVIAGFPVEAYVRYGTMPGTYSDSTSPASFAADEPIVIPVTGLKANTQYYYRFCYRRTGDTEFIIRDEYSFHTQRSPGSTFCFNITADSHLYDKKGIAAVMNLCMKNQVKDNPDFLIDLGDTFGDDRDTNDLPDMEEMMKLHRNIRPYFGQLCHSVPLILCLGNHEGENGFYFNQTPPDNICVYGTLARKFYYNNPFPDGFYTGNTTVEEYGIGLPENYYAFQWGDALFIVLDAYRGYTEVAKPRDWQWTLGKAQYDWFKETLENSSSLYTFVFCHHVLGETRGGKLVAKGFEWGGYNKKGTTYEFDQYRPGWGKPIHQLMKENKVCIFFQGHDHLFAREELDDIVYQTCPMPSDSTYEIGMVDNSSAFTGDTIRGAGHLRVTVSREKATVDFVSTFLPEHESPIQINDSILFSYNVKGLGTTTIDINQNKSSIDTYTSPLIGIKSIDASGISFNTSHSGIYNVNIFAFNGRLIWSNSINVYPGINRMNFDKPLVPALYILKVKSGQSEMSQKIVVR